MIRNFFYLTVAAVLLAGCVAVHETKHVNESKPAQVLRHVVLFKFKDSTTPAQIRAIENAFCALPSKVDAIYDFEWGTDVSVEDLAQGFTHCFFVSFRSEADRAEYLPHPDHKEFGKLLGPYLDKVLVIDYWAKQ
ncbi:MAG: Dabb family protein [Planctomycetota bacterium]